MTAALRTISFTLCALLALSACKLQVMVPQGGEVLSIGSGGCATQTVCVFEIDDTDFSETFTAVPQNGWDFLRWNSGGDFLCADSTNTTCVVDNTLLAGNPLAEAIIASKQSYYIQPVFQQRNDPITDIITAAGFELAQVDLFTERTWHDIAAVCPIWNNGICDGTLNGWDMTGWTWADWPTINAVFNFYGKTPPLPLVPPNILGGGQVDSAWAPAFFDAGWRPTLVNGTERRTEGWLRNESLTFGFADAGQMIDQFSPLGNDVAQTAFNYQKTLGGSFLGAWFYRVPVP